MEVIFLLGGVILGSIITRFVILRKTGYGTFSLEPIEDGELEEYTICVGLRQGQALLDKRQIILKREESQK